MLKQLKIKISAKVVVITETKNAVFKDISSITRIKDNQVYIKDWNMIFNLDTQKTFPVHSYFVKSIRFELIDDAEAEIILQENKRQDLIHKISSLNLNNLKIEALENIYKYNKQFFEK